MAGNNHSNRNAQKSRIPEALPHPEILEGYDYVVEGSAERILAMFEQEQKHRHHWERSTLRIHQVSTLLGQLLGFGIAVAVFASATIIGLYGNGTAAAFIWVFGMAVVVMAGLVWTYAKSMGQRPLFSRPTMRTHFHPQKDKDAAADKQN